MQGNISAMGTRVKPSAVLPPRPSLSGKFSTVVMPDGNEIPAAGAHSAKALRLIACGLQAKITPRLAASSVAENPTIINKLPDAVVSTKLLSKVLKDNPETGPAAVLQTSLTKLNQLVDQGDLKAKHIVSAFSNTVLPTPEKFNSFCARVAPLLEKFSDSERSDIRIAAESRQKLSELFWVRANEAMRSQG